MYPQIQLVKACLEILVICLLLWFMKVNLAWKTELYSCERFTNLCNSPRGELDAMGIDFFLLSAPLNYCCWNWSVYGCVLKPSMEMLCVNFLGHNLIGTVKIHFILSFLFLPQIACAMFSVRLINWVRTSVFMIMLKLAVRMKNQYILIF